MFLLSIAERRAELPGFNADNLCMTKLYVKADAFGSRAVTPCQLKQLR